jgi:hypothetical protein
MDGYVTALAARSASEQFLDDAWTSLFRDPHDLSDVQCIMLRGMEQHLCNRSTTLAGRLRQALGGQSAKNSLPSRRYDDLGDYAEARAGDPAARCGPWGQ